MKTMHSYARYLEERVAHEYLISIRQRRVQRLSLTPQAQGMTIGGYVPIVLIEAASKAVVPVAIANEIKEVCRVRMHGRFQRTSPWITDWTGRQSRKAVGVIGRVHREVGVVQASLYVPASNSA